MTHSPTAAGYVERFNGLLKRHLESIEKIGNFLQELGIACFELNQRIQLHKPALVIKLHPKI